MTKRAAIVGGGIGGLTAAIGLIRNGWQIDVFERRGHLEFTGTGLGIWPAALRALDELGLGQTARAEGRRQLSGTIRRSDGSLIGRIDVDRLERKQGEPVYLLSRPALLRLLFRGVPSEAVHFGQSVTEPSALTADYDVVIGADGIRSGVREAMFGQRYGLRYCGAMTWRGTVDLDLPAGGEVWGGTMKFGFTPQEPGRTNWYGVFTAPEGSRPPLAAFESWCDPVPAILSRATDTLAHDLHYLSPLPSYVSGRMVLLGDAAHAMTPDLGQGACQALIDGVALARCLGDGDVDAGLAAYDKQRRRPTQRLAAMSLRLNRLSRSARLPTLRDALVRAALAFGPPA